MTGENGYSSAITAITAITANLFTHPPPRRGTGGEGGQVHGQVAVRSESVRTSKVWGIFNVEHIHTRGNGFTPPETCMFFLLRSRECVVFLFVHVLFLCRVRFSSLFQLPPAASKMRRVPSYSCSPPSPTTKKKEGNVGWAMVRMPIATMSNPTAKGLVLGQVAGACKARPPQFQVVAITLDVVRWPHVQ